MFTRLDCLLPKGLHPLEIFSETLEDTLASFLGLDPCGLGAGWAVGETGMAVCGELRKPGGGHLEVIVSFPFPTSFP